LQEQHIEHFGHLPLKPSPPQILRGIFALFKRMFKNKQATTINSNGKKLNGKMLPMKISNDLTGKEK
jgi:hypothetical protein